MDRSYIIIDGSHLFQSIHEIWRTKSKYKDHKLDIGKLKEALFRTWSLYMQSLVRVVFYFKQNDTRIKTMLDVPDSTLPGSKDHWRIKECGESLKTIPQVELDKLSPEYRDHFSRAEKGLDIKLACDSLLLIAEDRATDIIFLANDRDYIPLFESIQDLGGNVYLTALDRDQHVQKGLANLADKFLTLDDELDTIFKVSTKSLAEPPVLEQTSIESGVVEQPKVESLTQKES